MRGLRAALMGAERGGAAASARLAGTELMPSTGRAALQCMRTQWCGAVEIRADRAVGGWFAERLAELVKAEGDSLAADAVGSVPLYRERERERGYNQAALQAPGKKGSDSRTKRCC